MSGALHPLLEEGIIDGVAGQLKSGKEAEVWLVEHAGRLIAAKLYKERNERNFRNSSGYREGREIRNSRTRRAVQKGSRFGKKAEEDAWKSAEADALYALHAQGVRVPEPVMFYEGVLLMELVLDAEGLVAPRLIDAPPKTPDEAHAVYVDLRQQAIRMLSADLIHGDLSPYNILMADAGPTLIDFPQTLAAARNNQAESYFRRDIENVRTFLASYDPRLASRAGDARAIWAAYVSRELDPDFVPPERSPAPSKRAETPSAPAREAGDTAATRHATLEARREFVPHEERGRPKRDGSRRDRTNTPSRGRDRSGQDGRRPRDAARPASSGPLVSYMGRDEDGDRRSGTGDGRPGSTAGRGEASHPPRGAPGGDSRREPRGGLPRGGDRDDARREPRGGHRDDTRREPRGGHRDDTRREPRGGHRDDARREPRGGHRDDTRREPRGGHRDDTRREPRGGHRDDARRDPRGGPRDDARRDARQEPRGGPRDDSRGNAEGRRGEGPGRGSSSEGRSAEAERPGRRRRRRGPRPPGRD